SKMSEFSSSTAFMDYSILSGIIGTEESKIAVYVSGNQKAVVQSIRNLDPNADIITWQEYNKALYSALMLEKTLMYVFLAFMFLIICVNLKNSTRRLLSNKQKEGAMLRALGCSRRSVNAIFLGQGLVISVLGEILGVILGKILIANLQNVLKLVDNVVYAVSGSRTVLTQIPFNASIGGLETAIVCLFIFLLSLLFTLIGCRRIYRSEIMEVILNASY
ncbi:MAG: ABC transporter permease, partial [Spirochaetales bacterium]|nr:ABC transporter permease [Spirochaetales bacterium]